MWTHLLHIKMSVKHSNINIYILQYKPNSKTSSGGPISTTLHTVTCPAQQEFIQTRHDDVRDRYADVKWVLKKQQVCRQKGRDGSNIGIRSRRRSVGVRGVRALWPFKWLVIFLCKRAETQINAISLTVNAHITHATFSGYHRYSCSVGFLVHYKSSDSNKQWTFFLIVGEQPVLKRF